MFSRYAKEQKTAPLAAAPVTKSVETEKKIARKEPAAAPAQTTAKDKEARRKERLGEIKLELHKALLDNLNLSALEGASENDLRQEIQAIVGESLTEMEVVLKLPKRQRVLLKSRRHARHRSRKGRAVVDIAHEAGHRLPGGCQMLCQKRVSAGLFAEVASHQDMGGIAVALQRL